MKISYNWLKEYVPELPEAEKLRDVFIYHLCEVEGMEKLSNGDTVFDINILPNRAHDLLCHRGIAFELSGLLGISSAKDFLGPRQEVNQTLENPLPTSLKIEVKSNKCRRYIGRIIRGVKVGPSPDWLKERLGSIGQRSINNIVDATNLMMFDRGNPIHVFDLDKLASEKIIIRQAGEGETMTTLDGKTVKFTPLDMLIADEKDVLAIAGVKGGKKAEVDTNTKNILIEVANFESISVRKTAHRVGIHTDSVKRFENNLSPELCEIAMNDITELILEMNPGAVAEEVVDVYLNKPTVKKIQFSSDYVNKKLGANISADEMEKILKNYQYDYDRNKNQFEITVPLLRLDLETENDMVEEIGRVIGYDKITPIIPKINFTPQANETHYKILAARKKLLEDGYSEVMTYAFQSKGEVEVLEGVSDKKFLRTNLSEGLKESTKLNQTNAPLLSLNQIKIFEIGTVFTKDGEETHVAYADKKEIKEMSLEEFCKDVNLGVHPRLDEEGAGGGVFKMWSLYPLISRDISLWVPSGVESEQVHKVIKANAGELLVKEPRLVDTFTKEGRTSYAFRLVFQSMDRTLTDEEVNKIMEQIYTKIGEQKDWQIR